MPLAAATWRLCVIGCIGLLTSSECNAQAAAPKFAGSISPSLTAVVLRYRPTHGAWHFTRTTTIKITITMKTRPDIQSSQTVSETGSIEIRSSADGSPEIVYKVEPDTKTPMLSGITVYIKPDTKAVRVDTSMIPDTHQKFVMNTLTQNIIPFYNNSGYRQGDVVISYDLGAIKAFSQAFSQAGISMNTAGLITGRLSGLSVSYGRPVAVLDVSGDIHINGRINAGKKAGMNAVVEQNGEWVMNGYRLIDLATRIRLADESTSVIAMKCASEMCIEKVLVMNMYDKTTVDAPALR